ncbi:hypothetical protein V8B55DRAFT_1597405 [Mucor lusitanicus]|uniref:Uncharacterized protein n=2 Tax=Mucor circinelloides f. lusitanicus TaxID=29924 RepID=A0A162RRG7_MUCCL|nr:hypothetical protein FB192DRAFT_1435239 [Mucor lusitanicus]OAD08189.1 hypothetical protein MUCCIDRAFT_76897 [Mucor lusitanicus CBS 277.49]
MENINKTFVKRVLAAGQRHSIAKRANRQGFRVPVRIMKRRMIRNISSAAERMQRLFSRSPSPLSSQSLSDPESNDRDTDVFDFLDVPGADQDYNDTTEAAAVPAADADANNDWWFEDEDEQLDPDNDEELNSDDDDDEINSYIRFYEDEEPKNNDDDDLAWLSKFDSETANVDTASAQQQQQLAPSAYDASNAQDNVTAIVSWSSTPNYQTRAATCANTANDQQQLAPSAYDAIDFQESANAALAWLAKMDYGDVVTADVNAVSSQQPQSQPQLDLSALDANNSQGDASAASAWATTNLDPTADFDTTNGQHQQLDLSGFDASISQDNTTAAVTWVSSHDPAPDFDTANGQHQQQLDLFPLEDINSQGDASAASAWAANLDPTADFNTSNGQHQQLNLSGFDASISQDNNTPAVTSVSSHDPAPNFDTANGQHQQQLDLFPFEDINSQGDVSAASAWATNLDPTADFGAPNGQHQQLDLSGFDASNFQDNSAAIDFNTANGQQQQQLDLSGFDTSSFQDNSSAVDFGTANGQRQQLNFSKPDASSYQDNSSAALAWLVNLDPEGYTAADIEHLLLTQTSDLVSQNLASGSANAENANEMPSSQQRVANETLHGDVISPKKDAHESLPSSSLPSPISPPHPVDEQPSMSVTETTVTSTAYEANIIIEPTQGDTTEVTHDYPISPPTTSPPKYEMPNATVNTMTGFDTTSATDNMSPSIIPKQPHDLYQTSSQVHNQYSPVSSPTPTINKLHTTLYNQYHQASPTNHWPHSVNISPASNAHTNLLRSNTGANNNSSKKRSFDQIECSESTIKGNRRKKVHYNRV